MAAQLVKHLAALIQVLAQQNALGTLVAAMVIATLCGLVIAVMLRLLRWLLPWLLLAGVIFVCWKIWLLQPLWQWHNLAGW